MLRRILVLSLAVLGLSTLPVLAQPAANANFRVTITNLTRSQIFSPPLVAVHKRPASVFSSGSAATPGLTLLAEDGDTSGLAAELAQRPYFLSTTIADGPVLPGTSRTVEIQGRPGREFISVLGMLVSTNDAFFAYQGAQLPSRTRKSRFTAPAYDAGSEANNESCTYIPGPPCGNGGVRATDGAEGFIYISNGVRGIGDITSTEGDWRNPVARILIEQIP